MADERWAPTEEELERILADNEAFLESAGRAGVRADFSSIDLADTNLGDVNLAGVNLRAADLSRINLKDANLRHANLGSANLTGANLGGANLTGANLVNAHLMRASLNDADITGATLVGANLWRADLTGAKYNMATKWPDEIPPEGAILVDDEEPPVEEPGEPSEDQQGPSDIPGDGGSDLPSRDALLELKGVLSRTFPRGTNNPPEGYAELPLSPAEYRLLTQAVDLAITSLDVPEDSPLREPANNVIDTLIVFLEKLEKLGTQTYKTIGAWAPVRAVIERTIRALQAAFAPRDGSDKKDDTPDA